MDKRKIAAAAFSFAGLALASEWIVRGADMLLAFIFPDGALDLGALRGVVGIAALVAGVYLWWSSGSAKDDAYARAIKQAENVCFQIANFGPTARPAIRGEVKSLYVSLRKLGFATPSVDDGDLEIVLTRAGYYIGEIFPLIRDRHIKDARQKAVEVSEAAEQLRLA